MGMGVGGVPLLLRRMSSLWSSYQQLKDAMQAKGGEPESQPWVLFDTQTYAQAGSASLTFFSNATAANAGDPTLSNFANGTLDAQYFFEIHRMFAYAHIIPAAPATATIAGPANDVHLLHKTARANLSWTLRGRPYGGFPLWFFGAPGGPASNFTAYGTAAAIQMQTGEFQQNGGMPILGNLIIPPATQFKATMNFNPTVTAISAAAGVVVAMLGVMHRPVA